MKMWIYGGRAAGTHYRVHLKRYELDVMEQALFEFYHNTQDLDAKRILSELRVAKRKALKIVLEK